MKQTICSVLGVIGSVIASFFGGWDAGLATLLIFMGLDYISDRSLETDLYSIKVLQKVVNNTKLF